mmetsp:Transcript_35694/g.87843  ORF Transcript_35694/g.87843 Transcript_35694/m.87843 type:complete len:338 (+) Transcript_35694:1117-2130(+)
MKTALDLGGMLIFSGVTWNTISGSGSGSGSLLFLDVLPPGGPGCTASLGAAFLACSRAAAARLASSAARLTHTSCCALRPLLVSTSSRLNERPLNCAPKPTLLFSSTSSHVTTEPTPSASSGTEMSAPSSTSTFSASLKRISSSSCTLMVTGHSSPGSSVRSRTSSMNGESVPPMNVFISAGMRLRLVTYMVRSTSVSTPTRPKSSAGTQSDVGSLGDSENPSWGPCDIAVMVSLSGSALDPTMTMDTGRWIVPRRSVDSVKSRCTSPHAAIWPLRGEHVHTASPWDCSSWGTTANLAGILDSLLMVSVLVYWCRTKQGPNSSASDGSVMRGTQHSP